MTAATLTMGRNRPQEAPVRAGTPTQVSSLELVRRARGGDRSAWQEIVDRHEGLLWWLTRQFRLSADDAADVVQLTWLRCLEHLDQLVDVEALSGWLATICRRECLRLARRRAPEVLISDLEDQHRAWPAAGHAAPDPYEEVARRDERIRLRQAIDDLPARPRTVLMALLSHEGQGYAEVARELGVPIGSLGPTRNRALARLREDPRLLLADG